MRGSPCESQSVITDDDDDVLGKRVLQGVVLRSEHFGVQRGFEPDVEVALVDALWNDCPLALGSCA